MKYLAFLIQQRVVALIVSSIISMSINATATDEMDDLLALLEEQTELATQSKMNADFVPGMVTVLHSSDLLSSGALTVAEGLERAAGFYMTVDNAGAVAAIVRGVGANLTSTNLKMMLNGIAMNRPYDGTTEWLLRMPLEQVERVEIIRGPGSSLYGEFAFAGVVNVITKQTKEVAVRVGPANHYQGDLILEHEFTSGLKINTNLSAWQQDNRGFKTNEDNFAGRGFGYSPGTVYDHNQAGMLLTELKYDGYQLQFNYSNSERGGWYGRTAAMPQDVTPRQEIIKSLSLTKNWEMTDSLSLGALVHWLETDLTEAAFLPIPLGIDPPGPDGPLKTNTFRRVRSNDESLRAQFNINWSVTASHRLFAQLAHAHSKVNSYSITRFELGQQGKVDYGNPINDRKITSFTIQDLWHINEQLELTIGARVDDYSDFGHHISPRLAAVWRASDHHIFKLQYSEAFRPPTMREINPDSVSTSEQLSEEKLASTEWSYIYRDPSKTFRSTLFHTEIKDLIEFFIKPGEKPLFRNIGSLQIYGLELEWQQKINSQWQWLTNLSYSDVEDKTDDDGQLTGSVQWLANVGVNWQQTPNIQHYLYYRYVGEQEGWDLASRGQNSTFDAYHLANYSLTLQNVLNAPNFTARIIINNIANHHYNIAPVPANYPTGLPRGQREAWLTLGYNF